ncbi:MAG: outer membrane protein OmpA-like peptidoglycan-associated protein [Bacteroidia bacterium]
MKLHNTSPEHIKTWGFALVLLFLVSSSPVFSQDTLNYRELVASEEGKSVTVKYYSEMTGLKQSYNLKTGRWEYFDEDNLLVKLVDFQADKEAQTTYKDGLEIYLNLYGDTVLIRHYRRNVLIKEEPKMAAVLIDGSYVLEIHDQLGSLHVSQYRNRGGTYKRIQVNGGLRSAKEMVYYQKTEDSLFDERLHGIPSFKALNSNNYISNPRFEQHSISETRHSIKDQVFGWSPSSPSPDFYVSSESYSGDACMGFRTYSLSNDIEYVKNKLVKPLDKDSLYCLSFYIRLAPWAKLASGSLGFYITEEADINIHNLIRSRASQPLNLPVLGSKMTWMNVQCMYRAKGGETYFHLGSFTSLRTMDLVRVPGAMWECYFLLDDVSLVPISSPATCACNQKEIQITEESSTSFHVTDSFTTIVGSKFVLPDVFFNNDQDQLLPESVQSLMSLSEWLEVNPDVRILIGGHTNFLGTHAHNIDLSERRARSVKSFLEFQGIASVRIEYKGYGPDVPRYGSETLDGLAKNRRVEIEILEN